MAVSIPEGSMFPFPRRSNSDGFAIVARRVPRGRIVALYLYSRAPEGAVGGRDFELPDPGAADARATMADYAMRDGTWVSLGIHPSFRRGEWPFREVCHAERGYVTIIELDDRNPLKEIGQRPGIVEDVARLPPYSLLAPNLADRLVTPPRVDGGN